MVQSAVAVAVAVPVLALDGLMDLILVPQLVEVEVAPGLRALFNPEALEHALGNLIDNALKYCPSGATVRVSAQAKDSQVQASVADDGPGIPADRRESVFRPFESDVKGGTGLGLTIARDIVRAHGGDIVLEQSPLGGLRASVRLPM